MNTNEESVLDTKPANKTESTTHDISGVLSGEPIGIEIECEPTTEGGAILKVLLRLHMTIYHSVRLIFYPLDNHALDTANFADTPMHASQHDASTGQDISVDMPVPSVNRSSEYGILAVGFGDNASVRNAAHKLVSVSPKSDAHTITSDANATQIVANHNTD